jgi:hypothetical protein
MFCPACGKEVAESDAFCRYCARSLSPEKRASTESAQKPSASIGPAIRPEEPLRRSGEATASLILGLFSFIPLVGLLAVIFGHLAHASIRRTGGRLLGEGMALCGLLLGYLGFGCWVIYWLSVLVHPILPSTARVENEHLAALSLETINISAITYSSIYNRGFPPKLAALVPPQTANAEPSENAAGLLDEVLASGTKSGYRFTYVAEKPDDTGRINRYTVHADPVTPGVTGEKHFFTNYSGVIRFEIGKEATAESPPIRK